MSPIVKAGGGKAFFSRKHEARLDAMDAVRRFSLGESVSTSGAVRFDPAGSNSNDRTSDTTTMAVYNWDYSNSPKGIHIAKMLGNGVQFLPSSSIHWPGGRDQGPEANVASASAVHRNLRVTVRVLTFGEDVDGLLSMTRHAANDINRDLKLLPSRQLACNVTVLDDAHDDARAVLEELTAREYDGALALVVGESFLRRLLQDRKGSAMLKSLTIPVVAYASSAVNLGRPSSFPTLARIGHSNQAVAQALVDTFQDIGTITRVFVLYDINDTDLSEVAHALATLALQRPKIEIQTKAWETKSGTNTSVNKRVTLLEKALDEASTFAVIVPLLASPTHLCELLQSAVGRGMFGGKHQLIFADLRSLAERVLVPTVLDHRASSVSCTAAALMAMDGMLEFAYFQPWQTTWSSTAWGKVAWTYLGPPYEPTPTYSNLKDGLKDAYTDMPTPAALVTSARLYDAVRFIAAGADACFRDATCDVGVASQFLPRLRASSVDGITGRVALQGRGVHSNDRAVQPFALRNCRVERRVYDTSSSISAVSSISTSTVVRVKSQCTEVGEVGGGESKLVVCPSGDGTQITRMGPQCALQAEAPTFTSWAPSSSDTIMLKWVPSNPNGGLLSGYMINAIAMPLGERVWTEPLILPPNATQYVLQAATSSVRPIEHNTRYMFTLQAIYDQDMVTTDPARSNFDRFLACLPSSGDGHEQHGVTCGCRSGAADAEFHTYGLPNLNPQEWRCDKCPAGLECGGRSFTDVATTAGWFVSGNQSIGGSTSTGYTTKRPKLYPCPGGAIACPGNTSVLRVMLRNESAEQQCGSGHIGVLCASCAEGYSFAPDTNRCSACTVNKSVM